MKNTEVNNPAIPRTANFVHEGAGAPVILIHGIAASLYDWSELIPELTREGYASYAVDLLGHGDSPKPETRAYRAQWLIENISSWIDSLRLSEPLILVGHSLGGYIAMEFARRFADRIRGLVLVSPFYSRTQLPFLLRRTYGRTNLRAFILERTPQWMFRFVVDMTSVAMGHSSGAAHQLPEHIRRQTALDYIRTAPGVYHIPNEIPDANEHLSQISAPTLVVWGERDRTLAPSSFPKLVSALPNARGKSINAGHVPHQSDAPIFNRMVLDFLASLR